MRPFYSNASFHHLRCITLYPRYSLHVQDKNIDPKQERDFLIANQRIFKMENTVQRPLNLSKTMIVRPPILASAWFALTPKIGQR
jgi:hypothetical protein